MGILEEIREKIPTFKCLPDCGECCTCHCAMVEEEKQKVEKAYSYASIQPDFIIGDLHYYEFCMFLDEKNRCSIYEERPIRCRLYGCTDKKESDFTCPHGCHPEKPWTEEELNNVLREYEEAMKGQKEYVTIGLIDGQLKPITRGWNG